MVLITGASGLVGTYLLNELLPQATAIKALYHSTKGKERAMINLSLWHSSETLSKINWIYADITQVPELDEVFQNVDAIYHCAGFVSTVEQNADHMRKVNIEGTANMVNFALKHKVKKFCHVSSIAALGHEMGKKSIDEQSPRNNEKNDSSYALSKFGGEMEVWRASEEGLNVIIVNPGVIFGIGNWKQGSGRFFSKIDAGLNYHLPKVTGFVSAKDVAKAMALLMNNACYGKRYILVAENRSIKSILKAIARSLHKKPPQHALRPWMVFLGWIFQTAGAILWNANKELTRNSMSSLFEHNYYSSERIKRELDFKFTVVDDAIAETAQHYLRQKKNSRGNQSL